MSIKVLGVLELTKEEPSQLSIMRRDQISFFTVEAATKNRIGIKLGINVFPGFLKKFKVLSGKILFELIDDPMDVNAECLFMGNGIGVYSGDLRVNSDESLASRMLRVQKFLIELLKLNDIKKITLNINALDMGEDDFETIEINVQNFCNTMINLYKQNDNWTPVVKLMLNKYSK